MSNIVYQPSQTTHWKNLFPNKSALLGAHNLNNGEELVVQIASVNIEQINNKDGKKEQVPVLKFNNAPPMVLNITNTRTIAALYGNNYDSWAGKYIQLYATMVKAFGKEDLALRVRPKQPQQGNDFSQYEGSLKQCQSLEQLKQVFMAMPPQAKTALNALKDEIKGKLQ